MPDTTDPTRTVDFRVGDLLRIVTPGWEGTAIISDVTPTEDGTDIALIPDPSPTPSSEA